MMPNVGAGEIVLLLLVALLLFGPKRLPEMGRSLGKGLRDFKEAASGAVDELGSLNEDEDETV
jgi:sec-independent protein translocase protein TatA